MLKTTKWLISFSLGRVGNRSKFAKWKEANYKFGQHRDFGTDAQGRDNEAVALALAGATRGETKASLTSRVRRKYRDLKRKYEESRDEFKEAKKTERLRRLVNENSDDDILDAADERD